MDQDYRRNFFILLKFSTEYYYSTKLWPKLNQTKNLVKKVIGRILILDQR